MLILLIILLLVFGVGGGWAYPHYGPAVGLPGLILLVVILWLVLRGSF